MYWLFKKSYLRKVQMIDSKLPYLEFLSLFSYKWETAETWIWSQTNSLPQTDARGCSPLDAGRRAVRVLGRKTRASETEILLLTFPHVLPLKGET